MSEKPRPRDLMPEVWKKIGEYRRQFGAAHVSDCIKRGMSGEPDCFYAFEAGHVVGTPFKADPPLADYVKLSAALGGKFAVVIRLPEGATRA